MTPPPITSARSFEKEQTVTDYGNNQFRNSPLAQNLLHAPLWLTAMDHSPLMRQSKCNGAQGLRQQPAPKCAKDFFARRLSGSEGRVWL